MSDTPPGADWRDVPWHKRNKAQRQARFEEAEAGRRAKHGAQRERAHATAAARRSEIGERRSQRAQEARAQRVRRIEEIKARRLERREEIRQRHATTIAKTAQAHVEAEPSAPPASRQPRRIMPRGAKFLFDYVYWASTLELILVLAPIILGVLALLGVVALATYLVVT
ncbi:MAG: hypothetical protein IE926_11060 [Micrococcales bacterium]|nr:hypothetical protein [Micrococcales bacterium]